MRPAGVLRGFAVPLESPGSHPLVCYFQGCRVRNLKEYQKIQEDMSEV